MLTRIYGTAFFTKAELAAELERLEQARARDHRKLGRELGLFTFSEVSPGSAFWLPRGTRLFNQLVALSREMGEERGFTEVKTPLLYDSELWKTSGHWGKYRENMFVTETEGHEIGIKPMNCPGHAHLFRQQRWSYRELPVRYAEPGLLHRNELSGTLHGLLRVRHFIQDDAHIFCTEDQVEDEVRLCLEQAFATFAIFGFEVQLELSTRPGERIGSDDMWDRAEGKLTRVLEQGGMDYQLNPGDGAFYGPKIDLHTTDSLGRSWQLGTVQLDYSMPERFRPPCAGGPHRRRGAAGRRAAHRGRRAHGVARPSHPRQRAAEDPVPPGRRRSRGTGGRRRRPPPSRGGPGDDDDRRPARPRRRRDQCARRRRADCSVAIVPGVDPDVRHTAAFFLTRARTS